ncbi:MAG: putative drug transport protein, partial [Caproiciproducens sp.]|nr:putative drug transport protein [Caproiciproducens sp.]
MKLDNSTPQSTVTTKVDPWEAISSQKAIFAFICILLSYSIYYVDRSLVTNIMPRVAGQLNGMNLYSWVFTVNMLVATCMAPIWGKLSDTYGRRNIFLTMLSIIIVGLILCAVTPSFIMLIAARGIVGIGTGGLQAVTFAIIADLFAPAKRGKYSGFTVVTTAVASTLIPVLAGWVTDVFGWRWSFILPIPLAFIALILVYFVVPNICSEKKGKMDYLGSLLLATASVPLLLAFSWAGSLYRWGTPVNDGLIGFSLAMFVVFYRHESSIP